MEHFNGLPTPNTVVAPLGTYYNGSEDKIDWPNSYASVIGMMLYLSSNTKPDTTFFVQQCSHFTHSTKASHETSVKRILQYLQITTSNGMLFNPLDKLVVVCYYGAYFERMWVH